MRGLRRRAGGRASVALLLPVLVAAIVLMSGGVALADQWTDISDSTWVNTYGVTPAQAAVVSDGYTDGTFRPMQAVTRGQFAKFVVDGFGISKANPATPTFSDVGKSSLFYAWIEGGALSGVLSGYTDGTYKSNNTISRQQSNNILGSYLSKKELTEEGGIKGSKSTYATLNAWYAAEGPAILAQFKDATSVAAVHAPGTAYLVYHEVVKGSNGNLTPNSSLTRAQAVALIVRVKAVTFDGGGPGPADLPVVSLVNPAAGQIQGGNAVSITGVNFTGVTAVKFGSVNATSFTVNSATSITAIAPAGAAGSTVDVTVTNSAGTSEVSNSTKYSYGLPTVTLLEPNGGSGAGGTVVTITGTGFTGVTHVRFGTTVATSFVVLNPTAITAVSPAGTTGATVDVIVTTAVGSSVPSEASKYTYGVPTITKLEPAAGAVTGGNTVIITGTGFTEITGAAGVRFGTVNATSYTVNSTTQITAVAPAGTSGTTVDVTVTNTVGTSGTSAASKYSYGGPVVTSVNPKGGVDAGGTLVAIMGTGFSGVSAVKFGDKNATTFTVVSPTQIRATAPAWTSGSRTVEVTVITPAGTSPTATSGNDYTYGTPTITGLNPAAGPFAGGNSVVITGTNFREIASVKFGDYTASYTVNSETQITATAPGGTNGSTVDVVVTNEAGLESAESLASKYSYGIPTITKLTPNGGTAGGGNNVVITGTGFTGASSVKFGGNSASFSINSPTQITAVAPFGSLDTIAEVTVTTPAGTNVTAGTANDYQYIKAPTVTEVSPGSGPTTGNTPVTITGTYFVGVTQVKFGSTTLTEKATGTLSKGEYQIVDDNHIAAVTPSGSGTVSVRVTNSVGTNPDTAADDYVYGMPMITSLNPAAGPNGGGNTVIINGSGFVGDLVVEFGDNAASIVGTPTLTQITVTAPAPATANTTVDVTVTNGVGTSETSNATKYSYGVPTITNLEPAGGPTTGGTSVVITGTGFTGLTGAVAVQFGSWAATSYTVNSPTQITAVAPAQAAGVVQVKVTNPAGTSTGTEDDYTYGGPSVTGLTPAAGPAAGSNSVVITGTGFLGTTAVKFKTTPALSYAVNSDTQITATAPSGAAGTTVDVRVTAGGLTSINTQADDYSYGAPTITQLDPTGGPNQGGNTVVITGTGFSGVTSVMFGGQSVSASNYTVDSPTQITAKAPNGPDNTTVDVTVTTPAGTSGTGPATKYSFGVPTITSLAPVAGSASGGNNVVISGTNLASVTAVHFGAQSATSFSYSASTEQITAKAPNGPDSTAVEVTVTNSAGTSPVSTAPDLTTWYTFGVPQVTNLNPPGGDSSGGDEVVITGDGFTGVTEVKFGTKVIAASDWTVNSPTQITVSNTPSGTGTVEVTVKNPVGTSSTAGTGNDYSYGIPTVTGVSPVAGPTAGGTLVTVTGTNLLGATEVKFGSTLVPEADWEAISSTQISVIAPAHAQGTVDVTVKSGAGTSAPSAGSKYSYGAPIVTGLDPNNGPPAGGNQVIITGDGFTGVTAVKFDTSVVSPSDYTVNSPTQITVSDVPAGDAGELVEVTVTNPVDTSSTVGIGNNYSYGLPTITMLSPASGPTTGGNQIVITGTNFPLTGGVTVTFGAAGNGTPVIVDASTQIRVTAPAQGGAGPTVDVTVTTPAGTTTTHAGTKYSYGPPTVTNLNPAAGPAAGNNTVVITGTGFTGVDQVKFGTETVDVSDYTVNGPTQITVTDVPSGEAGSDVEVTVHTSAGTSSTSGWANNYTYGIPVVTAVAPAAGPAAGGNSVIITGKGFLAVETGVGDGGVKFGAMPVDSDDYEVVSATEITVTVPAGTEFTTVDVYVTNPAGTSLSSDATTDTTDSSKYSYGKPQVLSVSPLAGPASGGNTVTITGTGFTGVTAATSVKFGGVNATSYIVDSPTQIRAVAPPGTEFETVDIYVTNPEGTSASSDDTPSTTDCSKYTYGEPRVDLLDPSTGISTGGTVVNISGKGFNGVTAVKFGSKNATSYIVVSPELITAVAPSGTAGNMVQVTVTNPVGTSSTSGTGNDFTYF